MGKPGFLIESFGRGYLLIIFLSIFLLTTVLSELALSQNEGSDDDIMRQVVQYLIRVGTDQYERGYYIQAEKTFLMAHGYQKYLTELELGKLSVLMEKAHVAALGRKRALERKQIADELIKQRDLSKAKTHLENIKDSEFLTDNERGQVAELLNGISKRAFDTEAPVRDVQRVKPLEFGVEEVAKKKEDKEQSLNNRKREIAALYYRSVRLYHTGELEKARACFIEVANSGLIPAPMEKTIKEYLTQIDNKLDLQRTIVEPRQLGDLRTARRTPEITVTPIIESDSRQQNERPPFLSSTEDTGVQEPPERTLGRIAAEPSLTMPELTKEEFFPETIVTEPEVAEPVTEPGSYIDEITRRRSWIRGYTRAVVNDAIAKAQKYINQGSQFDKAEDVAKSAERIVNQNQLQLDDELFKLYSSRLKELKDEIARARLEKGNQLEEQKRIDAIETQRSLRERTEIDRQKRIAELLGNAKAYMRQQLYEAALGQLASLLALDPQNEEALTLRDTLEDMRFFQKQIELQKESDRQRAEMLLKTDESGIPYADELTYPKDWREIIQKPTRQPDEPIGLDPADLVVYQQLDQIVDLSLLAPQMSFGDALEELKRSVSPPLNIVVLWRDLLDNAEIEPTTEINMDGIPSVRLRTALEKLLEAVAGGYAELGYVVDGGVITIATVESLPSKLETRVYDVTDLIGQPANYMNMGMMMTMGGMGGGMMGGMGGYGGGMGGGMYGGGMGGMGGMYGGGMGGGGMGGYGGGMGGMGGYGGGMGGMGGMGGYGGGMGGYGGGMGGYGGGMGGYGGGMGGYGGGMGGGMYGGGMGGGMMGGMMGGGDWMSGLRAQDMSYLIQETIEPESWYDYGGEGTITIYPSQQPKKLAVLATRQIHRKIENLLNEMRKALGQQVSIEARFLVVTENFLEDIGLDLDLLYNLGGKWGQLSLEQESSLATYPTSPTKVAGSFGGIEPAATITGGYGAILDNLQVSFILRAAQAHADAKSLTAPRVTVLSGESAYFSVQDTVSYALPPDYIRSISRGYYPVEEAGQFQNVYFVPIGSVMSITPTITKDKRNVLLNIVTQMQDLLRMKTHTVATVVEEDGQNQLFTYPVTVPETQTSMVMTRVSVPDGGTLLLGGQKVTAEIEKEVGIPILSKIPILGRAFSNRSKIRDQKILLILVKPTIILQEEREKEAIAAMESAF